MGKFGPVAHSLTSEVGLRDKNTFFLESGELRITKEQLSKARTHGPVEVKPTPRTSAQKIKPKCP